MPLDLISGLPNTGRTEKLREEFEEAARAGRNPILLVPSVDDVFAWERRLTRTGDLEGDGRPGEESSLASPAGGFAGGSVMHFNDLCREIARRADGSEPRIAGEMRRRLALERAIGKLANGPEGPAKRIEGKTASQPGLLDAALELVDEYRAERSEISDPFRPSWEVDLGERPGEEVIAEIRRGIEPLVDEFELDLADNGLTDLPMVADRAIATAVGLFRDQADWRDRSLFVAGFDDLTGQQLELLRKLSEEAGVEVTMATTWKPGLDQRFMTDRLMHRLRVRFEISTGADDPSDERLPDTSLAKLAAALISNQANGGLDGDPPLTMIRAAGERKEAEAIAAEIARLLASGKALPDQIAVAHRDPDGSGRLLEGVLRRYGIPVTLESETGALATSVGASLAALLRASAPDGTAGDLILWLRGPLGPGIETVDEIESKVRRRGIGTARKALELVPDYEGGEWVELFRTGEQSGGESLALIGDLAREAGQRILREAATGSRPDPEVELEVRVAETLAEAARDLAVADTGGRSGAALLLEAIRRGEISVWTVPTQGTVRIASLWALRAKRVRYLFVAGLQEGGTRDLSRAGPFLSTAERRGLDMLERVDPEVLERYLLFSCLNVPTEAIWLSCTISDDGGGSTAPSPLLDELIALCPGPVPLIERTGADVAFPADAAPTASELARSLILEGAEPGKLSLDEGLAEQVTETIARARAMEERSRTFGGFRDAETLDALAKIEAFSPSELEAWLACPWSWLIDRKIRAEPFHPESSYLVEGTFVHAVLERLYREAPGPRPEPDDLDEWLERIPGVLQQVVDEDPNGYLTGDEPTVQLARFTLEKIVRDFLLREASLASPDFVPALFEQAFRRTSEGEEPDPDALDEVEMDGWRLRGTVDRIDIRGGASPKEGVDALVIDYKTGAVGSPYSPGLLTKYGKVQIPLYMEAIRRSLGLNPVAGFVLPLGGQDPRPRGPIPSAEPEVIGERGHVDRGLVDSVDDFVDQAVDLATDAVEEVRGGAIAHSARNCRDHFEDPDGLLPEESPLPTPEVITEAVSGESRMSIGATDRTRPPLSAEQDQVVASRATDLMVAAAAGSGKTSVTVERYRRLLEEGLTPDQILVFTFTDKAAAKLREEVRFARSEKAGEPVSMSDAWVGTFHSICSRILTAYPIEAGVDPGFSVIDDITAENLRDQAFERALRSRLEGIEEGGSTEDRMSILSQVKQVTLKKGILAVFDLLRSRGEEFPGLELMADPPTYPEEALRNLSEEIGRALDRDDIRGFKDGGKWDHKGKTRKLKELIDVERKEPIRSTEISALNFNNAALEDATHIPSARDEIVRQLNECEGYPWLLEFDAVLRNFGQEYARLKEGRSALDYEDLQIKALSLLDRDEEVRSRYGSRFAEIMVDEFQDTNRLQMKLIDALRSDEATRLVTVGDEMQAIYSFRHADVGIFRERTTHLEAGAKGGELIRLPRNYRSAPAILETVNELGNSIHGKGGEGAPAFAPLVPGLKTGKPGPATTLLLTPEKGWEDVDLGPLCPADSSPSEADSAAAAEALTVASTLRDLVDSGEYSQGDIAVLLRATTRLKVFENALTLFGLRTVVPSSRGFWSSPPVRDAMALISVVANPLDDRALIGALTSPACGLGPDGLLRVREAAGKNSFLWKGVVELAAQGDPTELPGNDRNGDLGAIARLVEATREARERLDRGSLESVVTGLLASSGLDLASLARDRSSLASLERIATLAGEYERQENRDLRGFLDWAEASRATDSEAAIATSSEDEDAVKIMTVHKAKGLEFPVVCVPDLGRPLGRGVEGPVVLDFGPEDDAMRIGLQLPNSGQKVFSWPAIEQQADRETEAEELRLVHVAMTRARERLILSGRVKPEGDGNRHRLPAVNRILEPFGLDLDDPESWEGAIKTAGGVKGLTVETGLPSDRENRERLVQVHPLIIRTRASDDENPPLSRPERAFFPDVPLSFSGLSDFRECPTRFFARRVLRMEVDAGGTPWSGPDRTGLVERDGGTRFGTAVHEMLEASAANGWKAPDAARVEAALAAERVDREGDGTPEKAGEMITGFLESELGERVQQSSTAAMAELPIVLGIGGLTIRGFVDLLVEEDEEVTVVDYKTNQLNGRAPEELMEGYELQRDLYALAVARARNLDSIETAFVFLEEPNSPVCKTYGSADLEAVEERLRTEVVEPITAARYFGGPGGGPDPCGRCEACRILGLASD